MELGEKIRQLREARGWNQTELARRVGGSVKPQNIQQLEDGTVKQPRYLTALANAFDMTVDELLSDPVHKVTDLRAGYGVRYDLLAMAIRVVENSLRDAGLEMGPDEKAEFITMVYKDALKEESQGKPVTCDKVNDYVKAAAVLLKRAQ